MGLFDFLKPARQRYKYAQMLNGRMPIFSQFGTNIYASDVVQQAVYCIVKEAKKLTPCHIRGLGSDVMPVSGPLQRVLESPNAVMTTAVMLERIAYAYYTQYNAWIIPVRDNNGTVTALWPVKPSRVTFIEDAGGRLAVQMEFDDGTETTVFYSDVIHVANHCFDNDFMGGNAYGQPDNNAILQTVELNDMLMQGVAKGLKASYAVNGVVKYNTMLDNGTMEKNIKELSDRLASSESGLLPLDIKGDYVAIGRDVKLVDKDTLEFVDSKILRHFGVPLAILTGDYTPDQLAAFYQQTIEPFVVALSQAFTKGLFSRMEIGHNNKVEFYPEELIFMSTSQKLEMVRELAPAGTMYENEKRRIFGMMPLPELVGVRMQSLNWINQTHAADYQLQNQKTKEADDNAQDEEAQPADA